MKKLLCILFCIFITISCTKFEDTVSVQPKIHLVGDIIGLDYTLYGEHILDEIRDASPQMVNYFAKHQNDLNLRVHVYFNEGNRNTVYFTYYIGGVKICTNEDVLSTYQIKRVVNDMEYKNRVENSKNSQIKNTPPPTAPTDIMKGDKEL